MRFNDALIGVVLVAFAVAMMLYTRTFPAMPGQNYGPALFPVVIGIGLLLCGLALIAGGLQRPRAPLIDLDDWAGSGAHLIDLGAVVLGLLASVLLWDEVGFPLLALVLLTGLIVRFRRGHVVSSFAMAAVATFVVHSAFSRLLLVPLPLGYLEPLLW